jgi:hypothetical protein
MMKSPQFFTGILGMLLLLMSGILDAQNPLIMD